MTSGTTRLLFVVPSLRPGGAERQTVELIKGLHANGYDIRVAVTEESDEGYAAVIRGLGITIHHIERRSSFDLRPFLQLAQLIRREKIDIVHTMLILGGVVGVGAARLTGRPVVCSALRTANEEQRSARLYARVLARLSDFFVSNSRAAFDNLFSAWRSNFRVVHNGIDFSRFQADPAALENIAGELGRDRYTHVVGMVGSLSQFKDQSTFLEAARQVVAEFPGALFCMVGQDVDGKQVVLERQVAALGLQENVCFTGFRTDVDQVIRVFDIVVLLTARPYAEGTPNSLIEAMAVGKPVIASRGGGTDELLSHDRNGLLVDQASASQTAAAILRLLDEPETAERLASAGRKDVHTRYALERCVAEYQAMYAELMESRHQ